MLRMTVSSFTPLLEANRRLKIIQLFRDPRAVIHSRRYSRNYPLEHTSGTLERALCDKMMQDYIATVKLKKLFPDRIFILFYEDIAENASGRIYQLLEHIGIAHNRSEVETLTEIKVNLAPAEKGISFRKQREANNTVWWRHFIDWKDTLNIQSSCSMVMSRLGHRIFNSEEELRNISIAAFTSSDFQDMYI